MKKVLLVTLLIGYFVNWLIVNPVYAAQKQDFSLSIDPSIIEVQATPPSTPEIKIRLSNKTETEANLSINMLPFRMENDGRITYLSAAETKGTVSRIKDHFKVYDGITAVGGIKLAPLESKQLNLKIDVDNNLTSGDYYLAIVFSSQSKSGDQKTTVASTGGIASLLLLSVSPGSTSGRIAEYSSPLLTNGPVPFKLLVGNDSNHYIIPRGRIKITDMFGKNVGRVDILPQYILANSNRYLTDSKKLGIGQQTLVWPEKFLLGIYTAELTLNLSEKGPIYTRTIRFVSFPVLIVLAISIIIFVICGIILKVLRKKQKLDTGK